MSLSRRPPVRRCPRCGGHMVAWQEGRLCNRCDQETAPDSRSLVEMIRERRLERIRQTAPPDDGIPY